MCVLSSRLLPAGMATKSTFCNHLSSARFVVFLFVLSEGHMKEEGGNSSFVLVGSGVIFTLYNCLKHIEHVYEQWRRGLCCRHG